IMQLGIEASPQSPWLRATAFTEAEFRLVTATSAISTLTDDTSTYDSAIFYDSGTGFSSTLGHFIDGEWAEFVFPVQNSHPRLELNMALVFDTPGVSAVEAVLEDDTGATSALSGESISPPVSSVAATRTVTVPFALPAHVGRSAPRPYNVRVRVRSQVPDGVTTFGLSNVDLRETSLSYSSPQVATSTLGLTQFSATGWTIEKGVNGTEVELRFIPPADYQASAPLAALRVIDVTPTDLVPGLDPAVEGDVPFNTPEFNVGSQNAVIPSVTDAMRTASFRVVWSGYTYTVNVVFRASDQLEPNTGFTNLDDLQVDLDNALTATTPPTGAPALPAGLITVTQPGGAGNGLVFTLGDGGSVIELLSAGLGLQELGLSTPVTAIATRTEALAWLQNSTATGAPPVGSWEVRPIQEDVLVPGLEFQDPDTSLASSTLPFTVKAGARRGRFDSSGRSVVVFDLVPDASGSIDILGYIVATYALLTADGIAYSGTPPTSPTAASPSFTEVLKIAYPSTADDPQVLTWKDIPQSGTLERLFNDGSSYDF
ncbi:MAG: hypothetical protein VKN33_08760, partial [Candidatus Sericytochromatia bacterium]|nr:hypothetical protein [Candidatus Sericytochromatia bacterium]